jgi:2-polyprenyl-6-methoxyphenol hydroxylase-like FAD-dependent oxidoreductase
MNVGVVGGGIGGVAAGVALERAGIGAVVYERAPRLQEVGAGMMLWPNATRVLKELGVLQRLETHSGPNTNFLVRSDRGEVLMDIALGRFDVPALCARRADLLNVLLSALPPRSIRLGNELSSFEEAGAKVRLNFADGSTAEHDALIGADGLRSCIRSQLFGPSDPIYRGYIVWRGLANYAGEAIPHGSNSESWGSGKRFGILNTGHERFTWYAAVSLPREHRDASQGRKQELLEMFKGWHEPVEACIASTSEDSILKHPAFDLAPLQHWGRGRVTLLGDAAHPCTPNLGQGGCMALEDALALAKSLSTGASTETALRQYERVRRCRTSHVQRRSLLMGRIGQWENELLVVGRRLVTSILPARWFEQNLRKLYAYET